MRQRYRLITLTPRRKCFYQQPLLVGIYGVHAQMIINRFMQNNGPGIFHHENAMPHKTRITTHFLAQNNVNVLNVLNWPALFPVMNPIEQVLDELGRRTRYIHRVNTINDSNIHFCKKGKHILNVIRQCYVNAIRRRILLCICKNVGQTGNW